MVNIFIIGCLVLAITAIATSIYLPLRNTRNDARTWVRLVEKAQDDEQIAALGPLQVSTNIGQKHLANSKREERAVAKFNEARVRLRVAQIAEEYHTASRPGVMARVCLASVEVSAADTDTVTSVHTENFGVLFEELLADTVEEARKGDKEAIDDYLVIMRDPRLQRFCKRYKISLPADPDDWDDIVIRAVEFPTLDMLRNTRGHTKVEVLVMSRTAIATNDVGMAKRALAYLAEKQCEHNLAGDGNPTIECTCSDTRPFREYVGESLWNRLNDMIAEKDADTDPS